MIILEPNGNTILCTQIMKLPRCVTIALDNLQKGVKNGLPMNVNARAN